jgi:hypothetical protein
MNQEAFDTFWYFINERHKIYEHRIQGYPKPWSDDQIFQNWKFCNVFRQLDKQSEYLIKNVIEPHNDESPDMLLFNIFVFRAFNWWPTYQHLGGWQSDWHAEKATDNMKKYVWTGLPMSSGAYMIRGREGMPKYESIAITLDTLWQEQKDNLAKTAKHGSLQKLTEKIVDVKLWGWGPFTAYQIALDCSYSSLMPNPVDINTWCEFGPGGIKGIRLIYPGIKHYEMLEAARGLLLDSPKFLNREGPNQVPTLTLQDIEFSLCELGKYIRIKNGGRGKGKYNGRA